MFHNTAEVIAAVLIPIIFILVIPVIVFIAIKGRIKLEEMKAVNSRIESINNQSFENLVAELKEENAELKSELSEIKKILSSIDKMMKEI